MTQWWQSGAIYQIYPRSFKDANGDGIGDLAGITSELEYLRWLGVDALWLSPCYPSPMHDFGYDVSDYTDIHPDFGTLEDFDRLLAEAKKHGLRVILDFVPNHSSDQHAWFIESRASRDNPKRDWYVWCDAKPDGSPPNNWQSMFRGPAWTWDEATGQYYLHSFLKEQPDLNWRNPEVQAAMLDVLRFWMRRGVAGFRIDVVDFLMKDPLMRDNPPNPKYDPADGYSWEQFLNVHNFGHPDVHGVMRDIRQMIEEFPQSVSIGEVNYAIPIDKVASYYGTPPAPELHLPFNFKLLQMANAPTWTAAQIRGLVQAYDAAIPAHGWPNWVLGNHDNSRVSSRIGRENMRLAALLMLTLRGTPFIYYGEEIGMVDVPIPLEKAQDPFGLRESGRGRDPERTPMQWNGSAHAGFSPAHAKETWLPVADDYAQVNVAKQRDDPRSILTLYRQLLHFRRETPALHAGAYSSLDVDARECFVYLRQHGAQQRIVALNFSGQAVTLELPVTGKGRVVISTELDRDEGVDLGALRLRAREGVVIEV
jgi:alpha-glucosidase